MYRWKGQTILCTGRRIWQRIIFSRYIVCVCETWDSMVVLCRLDYWTQCELIKCGEYFHISFQPPAPAPHRYSVWCVRPEYCTPGCRWHISTDNIQDSLFCICIGLYFSLLPCIYTFSKFSYNCSHKSYIKHSCTTTIMHSTSSLVYCVHSTAQNYDTDTS